MTAFPTPSARVASSGEFVLRAAVAAYLGRYRGLTRQHSEPDPRVFLRWCVDHELDPLATVRTDIERYVRWLQDVRRYQPSTVSRRLSVVVDFYRVCVIDQILPHSPADYVRRPTVPTESPTHGLGHLQCSPHRTLAGEVVRVACRGDTGWRTARSARPSSSRRSHPKQRILVPPIRAFSG
jgi:integrase/recombinase XerD